MERKLLALLIIVLAAVAARATATDARLVENLNRGWRFSAGDVAGAEAPEFDDSGWEVVNLPHDFQIHQPWVAPSADERPDMENQMANVKSRLSPRGFKEMGSGWYRLKFVPDSSWEGRRVLLDFEGILLVGDVWLNGEHIASTDYGYLGFETDISRKLKFGRENVIAVKADTGRPENSRWYTGAGIYRDVNIIVTDPKQYIMRHGLHITTPTLSSVKVEAAIATLTKADSLTVGLSIMDPDGKEVYNHTRRIWNYRRQRLREHLLDSIAIEDARLWDCENPNLYTLTLRLYREDGTVADEVSRRFGIRQVEFSPEWGMKLNGKKVLLKGIANHHTLGALGAAAYPAAIEKRIKLLKDFGFNHIRTSHNPYSESLLDLCDRYGILVVDELYDKWTRQYCGGRTSWEERWQKDIPEWITRDRNHPSVIFWSLGNELQMIPDLPFNDWGVTPYRLQRELVRRYDPTRLTTVAMHPRGRNHKTDSLPAPLVMHTDIAAYNYRYMYFPGDSRRFPWMIFYQSEANTSGLGPNWFEMELDKVTGTAYWGMIDYLGESNGWPAKGWQQGVFDISLQPKPTAYFIRSFFKPEEDMVRIAPSVDSESHEWNGVAMGGKTYFDAWKFEPGAKVNIYTFTNADEVELSINGKSLGRKANDVADPKRRNRILWEDIPYTAGKVEARAYRDGRMVASHTLRTPSEAVRLTVDGDNPRWKADGMDLQHVDIAAVDRRGTVDVGADTPLSFTVTGPAEIVGVINGDMTSDELTVGSSRSLYRGRCSVILRSTGDAGPVELSVEGPGFRKVTGRFTTE